MVLAPVGPARPEALRSREPPFHLVAARKHGRLLMGRGEREDCGASRVEIEPTGDRVVGGADGAGIPEPERECLGAGLREPAAGAHRDLRTAPAVVEARLECPTQRHGAA